MKIKIGNFDISLSARQIHKGTIRNTYTSKDFPLEHYKFLVTCKYNGDKFSFVFNDSFANWQAQKTQIDKDGLLDALECHFADACCYEADELNDMNKRQIAGCKRAYEHVKDMFGAKWYKVADALNERFADGAIS